MSTFTVSAELSGQILGAEILDWIAYQRTLHTLHEFKRLGAPVEKDGKPLSDSDIDYLTGDEAADVSVAVRRTLGVEGAKQLFKNELERSNEFWRTVSANANGEYEEATTVMNIKGITIQDLQKAIFASNDSDNSISYGSHPEHFFVIPAQNGNHGMEAMGMYGEPTDMIVSVDNTLEMPVAPDPAYPMALKSSVVLAEDGTSMHTKVMNQFQPQPDGMNVKLSVFFPKGTPKEMVYGHQVHLAIEYYNIAKLVYQSKA